MTTNSVINSPGMSRNAAADTAMKWLPLLVLCLAQLSTSGDNATLSIATGALVSDLHASMDLISIANAMYSLAAGSLMVA
ncbi:MFS transporter, partial [Escherichia coli]|nr:MFS transporter [Escherichia coli]